jgi:hypothetical protein
MQYSSSKWFAWHKKSAGRVCETSAALPLLPCHCFRAAAGSPKNKGITLAEVISSGQTNGEAIKGRHVRRRLVVAVKPQARVYSYYSPASTARQNLANIFFSLDNLSRFCLVRLVQLWRWSRPSVKKAWFHASINASIINAIRGGNKRVSKIERSVRPAKPMATGIWLKIVIIG